MEHYDEIMKIIFCPEYSVVYLTFPFLSAIQTTQKNFVTAVDDKKIGIVETLVGPSTMITQDLEDSKYSFKTFLKVMSARKNSAVSWEMKLYQALLLVGRKWVFSLSLRDI